MNFFRDFRLLPVVLAAIIGLVTLKALGLVLDGGLIFNARDVSQLKSNSWAQEMLNFPGGKARSVSLGDPADITGSVDEKKDAKADAKSEGKPEAKSETKPEAKSEAKSDKPPEAKDAAKVAEPGRPNDLAAMPQPGASVSASERAILERLADRRQELETRAREIDIRENLLKAAEKRIENKVAEMKAVEARIGAANEQKVQADADHFKGLVTMYESMKPKDAAKIFDRLYMSVLIQVASKIAPRNLSDIVGLMQPDSAERLTVELARRAAGDVASASNLPKIDGHPTDDTN